MNKQEAIQVLKQLKSVYVKFEINNEKASLLIPHLLEMDYQGVMDRLSEFAASHPYAPTIFEIAAYPKPANEYLVSMNKWKQEASLVSEQTKQQFRIRLETLMKEKANYAAGKL